jgi:Na+-driven multidrug efflux pump
MLLITAVINIVLNAILIPLLGMSGAAIASLISYISCGLMFTITFSRMTKETFGNIFIIKKSDIQQLFNKLKKS